MTKPTINRRQLLGTAALGIAAAPLAGCTGVSRQDSQPHYVMVFDQNKCVGCGRTDAGVHAEYYVANFHTNSRIPVERIPFAVNTHIPEDIVVRRAFEVAEDFNAIGSCIKKEYFDKKYTNQKVSS